MSFLKKKHKKIGDRCCEVNKRNVESKNNKFTIISVLKSAKTKRLRYV